MTKREFISELRERERNLERKFFYGTSMLRLIKILIKFNCDAQKNHFS